VFWLVSINKEDARYAGGVIMTTGNGFVLDAFETLVQEDAEVLGVLYTGSLGRGMADRYSDLDIALWVTAQAFENASRLLRRMMGYLGSVHFMYERGQAFTTGFVGSGWQRVDLELHRQTETRPLVKYAHARVVKDVDGSLAVMVAQVPQESIRASRDQSRAAIEEAIDSQIYLSLHNARGAVWSAMGEITYRCAELYTLLALLRGQQSFGFRYVEQILSSVESELLRETWPSRPEREEVRRAACALWTWTRHVWHEAEISVGRSLDIQIDDVALNAAVDQIYSSLTEMNRAPDATIESTTS